MLGIKAKIVVLVVFITFVTTAVLCAVLVLRSEVMLRDARDEIQVLAMSEQSKIIKGVWLMCRALDDQVRLEADASLNVAEAAINRLGTPHLGGGTVDWNGTTLPRLYFGNTWLGQGADPDEFVPVVDEVGRQFDCICSVFQLAPDSGLVRVATNYVGEDGRRALGSVLPQTRGDGQPHPVVQAVSAGHDYQDAGMVIGKLMMMTYRPVRGNDGAVLGAVATAVEVDQAASLRNGIMDIVVGKTGYVFVLNGDGDDKGSYVISADGSRDGENILDAKDANGVDFIQEMVVKALATSDGSVDFQEYAWEYGDDYSIANKIVAVTYFEPWDWVIGAGCYQHDYEDALVKTRKSQQNTLITVIIYATIVLIVALIIAFFLGSQLEQQVDPYQP